MSELSQPEELTLNNVMIERDLLATSVDVEVKREIDDLAEIAAEVQQCSRLRVLRLNRMEFSALNVLASMSAIRQLKMLDLSGARGSWKSARGIAVSDIPNLRDFDFLQELIVAAIDLPEAEIRAALPKTRLIIGSK